MNKIWGFVKAHRKAVLVVAAVLAVGLMFVEGRAREETYSWHYKITVTVDTPEGEKSGFAVREARTEFQPRPEPKSFPYHIEMKSRGEAVPVDLDKRGVLFALIDWDSYREFYAAFPYGGQMDGKSKFPRDDYYKKTLKPGMKAELKSNLPRMVTFKNIKDPKSVMLVYGGKFDVATQKVLFVNDFESIFGKGVKLKDITLEITDEPVTWNIDKVLGWLEKVKMSYLSGKHINGSELYEQLHGGNFRVGDLE